MLSLLAWLQEIHFAIHKPSVWTEQCIILYCTEHHPAAAVPHVAFLYIWVAWHKLFRGRKLSKPNSVSFFFFSLFEHVPAAYPALMRNTNTWGWWAWNFSERSIWWIFQKLLKRITNQCKTTLNSRLIAHKKHYINSIRFCGFTFIWLHWQSETLTSLLTFALSFPFSPTSCLR